jgi:hypothetical protein
MTRTTLVVGLCVLGVVGVASAAPGEPTGKRAQLQTMDQPPLTVRSPGEPAGKRARLQMMALEPLTVRGVGFVAGERVHVRATARGGRYSKTKVATGAGTFTVTFPVSAAVCRGYYAIQALGSRGSRAFAITRLPQLDCMAPDSRRGTEGRSTT